MGNVCRCLVMCTAMMLVLSACRSTEPVSRPLFGPDNRIEVIHGSAHVCETGSAVFAMFAKTDLQRDVQGAWRSVNEKSLSDTGWCSSMRFASQPATARCTGFLIAPDLIATAGHCLREENDPNPERLTCDEALFVLDFKLSITGEPISKFASHQVFGCRELVAGKDSHIGPDWRVVQLDRVPDRTPLTLYTGESLSDQRSSLHVVGHPLGLPMKAADEGQIFGYTNGRYRTTLDTFRGNSGSPVFTLVGERAVVIGMMSGGTLDKAWDKSRNCNVERICANADDCRGQLATDTRSFIAWASRTVNDISAPPGGELVANCAWCQDPLRSRYWQCPVSGTLE